MKILIVSQNNNYYTSLSGSLYRSFKKISNTLLFLSDAQSRVDIINLISNKSRLLKKYLHKEYGSSLISQCKKQIPDIIFVIKGTDIEKETLLEMKHELPASKIVCFNPDDPLRVGNIYKNIYECIPYYDLYFIWSRKLVAKIKRINESTYYLPFAADIDLIYPLKRKKDIYISFIGNGDSERERVINNLKVKTIDETKISIYGTNWKNLKKVDLNNKVEGNEFLEVLARSKINLNILRYQNKGSINMRTFEIPASGNFMLHEFSEEAQEYFLPGVEAEYFCSSEEFIEKSKYYLKNENARNRIAMNSLKKIEWKGYTYDKLVNSALVIIRNHK